jgi:hypothetical protein
MSQPTENVQIVKERVVYYLPVNATWALHAVRDVVVGQIW